MFMRASHWAPSPTTSCSSSTSPSSRPVSLPLCWRSGRLAYRLCPPASRPAWPQLTTSHTDRAVRLVESVGDANSIFLSALQHPFYFTTTLVSVGVFVAGVLYALRFYVSLQTSVFMVEPSGAQQFLNVLGVYALDEQQG